MSDLLLQVDSLTRSYPMPRERLWQRPALVHALRGVSLSMRSGRSLGVVGESGSGKSTLARLVMGLEPPTSGRVELLGQDLNALGAAELRHARRNLQMVFQDPYGSLDPRQTVARIVCEPLSVVTGCSPAEMRRQAGEVLQAVGLRTSDLDKYPHEFSGGQRQRVAIARALITRPRLIVADEPVSALDVLVREEVLQLLSRLINQLGLTLVLISHDLSVVAQLCDKVAVMQHGRIIESGATQSVFGNPQHQFTRELIAAVPQLPTLK